jgi:hypothetical protein
MPIRSKVFLAGSSHIIRLFSFEERVATHTKDFSAKHLSRGVVAVFAPHPVVGGKKESSLISMSMDYKFAYGSGRGLSQTLSITRSTFGSRAPGLGGVDYQKGRPQSRGDKWRSRRYLSHIVFLYRYLFHFQDLQVKFRFAFIVEVVYPVHRELHMSTRPCWSSPLWQILVLN